jgi:hypothetical protein
MALNKAQLAADLQAIMADGQAGAKSQAQVAQAIADAIDAFVRSGTVTTTVTGTCSTGPVAGVGTGVVG